MAGLCKCMYMSAEKSQLAPQQSWQHSTVNTELIGRGVSSFHDLKISNFIMATMVTTHSNSQTPFISMKSSSFSHGVTTLIYNRMISLTSPSKFH